MSLPTYNLESLNKFKSTLNDELVWQSRSPLSWWKYVFRTNPPISLQSLGKETITRQDLDQFCRNPRNSDKECLCAVMAWGGQNLRHGRMLIQNLDYLLPLINKLRSQKLICRYRAFEDFTNLRRTNKLNGMGIAYFTKLIFFTMPERKGYILDQWTAKSANLLLKENIIHLRAGYVSDMNTVSNYRLFCDFVEKLAFDLQKTPADIEKHLFSQGRNKGEWRNFVRNHYNLISNS